MMISTDEYYEECLKGKTAKQIMTTIRALKKEIGHLKNSMESPYYGGEPDMDPSDEVRLFCTRLYLDRAKKALVESGGIYTPSKAEVKAAVFDESVHAICKIVFSIGGFFQGHEIHTIIIDGENIHKKIEDSFIQEESNCRISSNYSVSKEELLDGIRELHIGEWRSNYYNNAVLDGTQWSLEIFFSDNHKTVKLDGSNDYPYNFNKFMELLGINSM